MLPLPAKVDEVLSRREKKAAGLEQHKKRALISPIPLSELSSRQIQTFDVSPRCSSSICSCFGYNFSAKPSLVAHRRFFQKTNNQTQAIPLFNSREKGGDILTTKKDIVIAVLATFCLTATLFLVIPTKSIPTQPYDAWIDINEDGKIGPADFAYFSTIYGATGDSTKNVNVTNWPQLEKPLFSEILNLRPACYQLSDEYNFTDEVGVFGGDWGYVLIDENMPAPPGEELGAEDLLSVGWPFPTWGIEDSLEYTHAKIAQSDYYIQGDAIISFSLKSLLFTAALDTVYFNVTVFLQSVDVYGSVTATLASGTVRLEQTVTVLNEWKERNYDVSGFTFSFQPPAIVHSGERLRIAFSTAARSEYAYMQGYLYVCYSSTYHGRPVEFEAQIPITKTGP